MNTRQKNIIEKEFPIEGTVYTICRGDYEGMPCAMVAWNWTDEKMTELADLIHTELDAEDTEERFWAVMENCAVRMGMTYYEDLDKEEYDNLGAAWNKIQ